MPSDLLFHAVVKVNLSTDDLAKQAQLTLIVMHSNVLLQPITALSLLTQQWVLARLRKLNNL